MKKNEKRFCLILAAAMLIALLPSGIALAEDHNLEDGDSLDFETGVVTHSG